jgi:D-alanyl-D-alanine carboxypeptidase/D-alanyl-D-alanine-endopeptidase (penicillin-binding protein 4)
MRRTVFLLSLLLVNAAGAAEVGKLPTPVARTLAAHRLPAANLSLYVQEVGEHAPVLAVNAGSARNPASVMKLLTTLAALEELGPAYTWKTEAWATAPVKDGVLEGDLTLKGYGDPYLVIEHFWRFLRALRRQGVETIRGDLVLDQSHFAPDHRDPGSFDGKPHQAYNVPPRALLVNFQTVNLRVVPQPGARQPLVVADPQPSFLHVENRVQQTPGPCRGVWRELGLNQMREDRVVLSGRYPGNCGPYDFYRVVSETDYYVHGVFKAVWTELGGRLEGGVRAGTVPEKATLLHAAESPPLAEIVRAINKHSNNVMTRQLLLTLGAEKYGPPGNEEKGIQALRGWLGRRGLIFPELVMENGSGLSRDERISAEHLAQLLGAGWQSPYMPEFLASLPVYAMDGTLRKRPDSSLAGRAHLKTGSLRDVRSVAGFVHDRRGRWVIVVALHNDTHADGPGGEAVQNALLKWVFERP